MASIGRVAVAFAGLALLLPAAVRAKPWALDGTALRAEVVARRAALTGTLDRRQARQAKALDRALGYLDAASASLDRDLWIAERVADPLEAEFRDEGLRGLLASFVGTGDGLVRGRRDALEAVADGSPDGAARDRARAAVDAADRDLAAADRARSQAKRSRHLGRALERIQAGFTVLGSGSPGGGGSGDGDPCASSGSARVREVYASPYPGLADWTADAVSATVTLDAAGNPTALRLRLARTSSGVPLATLDLRVDTGFTGAGTFVPTAVFDADGASSPVVYYTISNLSNPGLVYGLAVSDFDLAARRMTGTFFLKSLGSYYRLAADVEEGRFSVCGFSVEGPAAE